MFTPYRRARAAMALAALSGDEQCVIFSQLCNVLDPGIAVDFGSVSSELRELTQALLQQLRTDHEVAAVLCRKMGMRSCNELRETNLLDCVRKGLSAANLATLGKLGSVLPALEELRLIEPTAGPDGVQRLAERLGARALPALTWLNLGGTHVGNAGASALAAALGRGAMPRLTRLWLEPSPSATGIGDAGLVALAPALRRLPSLESIDLAYNPLGDEGLAALVAPPPLAGALSLTIQLLTKLKLLTKARVLTKLEVLDLSFTQITDAGCAALASALYSGTLPALKTINLEGIPASAASKAAVIDALEKWRGYRFPISQGIQRFCALHDIRCFEDGSVALWLYGSVQVFATLAHGYAEFVHSASVDVLTLSFVLTLSLRLVAAATCSALLTTYLYERGYFHRVEYFLYCVVSGVN